MLERVRPTHQTNDAHTNYVHLTVQKAISLLDKLYDTFFAAPRKAHVRVFSKHFIKIEFLDKVCRPVFKEFDEWPEISLEPDPPREKKDKKESENRPDNTNINNNTTSGQKMTRKSRPRIKEREREEKETKGGYCEMCNTEYLDAGVHRRSPHHQEFVRDHNNFLALDSLITAGADVATFLDKATPINGERRSLRKLCNGDLDPPRTTTTTRRSRRSQSPDSTFNGNQSPRRNGVVEDERKHNTRCSKRTEAQNDDRQYYKVVGVSTKLRSSGGFATKRKDSPPTCNGTKPLVVKIRKVRRSELSVLSDEAEQFMFPKRASSTSSTSSDDDDENKDDEEEEEENEDEEEEEKEESRVVLRRKSPPRTPATAERRRLARPVTSLKEESSEEDSWPEDKRRRKRRGPALIKRGRRMPSKTPASEPPEMPKDPPEIEETNLPETELNPLREEPTERCMKWEDGRLKYTPAVEQLEFAFESVPHSEPWFETFKRQDQDKVLTKNVPKYFALYSKSPKLPYEIGQLPPLKPNCCPLSDLVKREEKPGPSRSYGTRGMKKERIRKRTAAVLALESHPRKSPREHASTLAILGSAGLLNRRKNADDTKSTASEDTISDTNSTLKIEPAVSETQEASERLQQFLSEVFEDAAELDVADEDIVGETTLTAASNLPDVTSLVSECDACDIIRNEISEGAAERARGRRGKFKKKNRTGWPNKRKQPRKDSRTASPESERKAESSLDGSSADDAARDNLSEDDATEVDPERTLVDDKTKSEDDEASGTPDETRSRAKTRSADDAMNVDSDGKDDKPLRLDLKVSLDKLKERKRTKSETEKEEKRAARASVSEPEKEARKKKRALQGLGLGLVGEWLQPVVRVARVQAPAPRTLRSAARARPHRTR